MGFSYEELYEDAPCGYLILRPDGLITAANRTLLASIGRTADEVVGCMRLTDLLAPGSRILQATSWGPTLELAGEVREVALELLRADGQRLPVLLTATQSRDADGIADAVRVSLFDAADRHRYEHELVAARDVEREARQRIERLFAELEQRSGQQAAIVELGVRAVEGFDPRRLLVEAARVVGQTARVDGVTITADEPGGPPRVIATAGTAVDDPAGGLRHVMDVEIGPSFGEGFGRLQVGTRGRRPFSSDDRAFLEAVAHVLWNAIERRRTVDAAEHRALHDPLTGLPNRRLLSLRLEQEIARGHEFALCLLDLDDFKLINDSLGHRAGDELLCAVADRLCATVREHDLVARLGGDEFVVLCAEDGCLVGLMGRVSQALGVPFELDDAEYLVRASVGVVAGGDASGPDDVLRDADIAMYRAKSLGGGAVVQFDTVMRRQATQRLALKAELQTALNDGQLRVFYQPVIRATDERMVSMEALVRWEHPERGLVPPADFIPVAEASGLIVELGRFVLREACAQLGAWRRGGQVAQDVGVAVNVSGPQLMSPGFVAEVASALDSAGLLSTPSLLGLEITETALMEGSTTAGEAVGALSALGVRLLLDDFGTGTSSLARLRRLPMDTLKIDRAFITDLGIGQPHDDAMVAAVVSMAQAMGLDVIAEGVETTTQLEALRALGCHNIQGFLFSRPLSAAAMEQRLRGA